MKRVHKLEIHLEAPFTRALLFSATILLSACAVWFTPQVFPVASSLRFSNSILSMFLFALYGVLFYKTLRRRNLRVWQTAYPLGLLYAAFLVLGTQLSAQEKIDWKDGGLYGAVIAFSFVCSALLTLLWNWLDQRNSRPEKAPGQQSALWQRFARLRHKRLLLWLLLIACWVPVWLAVFPGLFCYDANAQWRQIASNAVTAHHPPLHTLLLGGTIQLVHALTGSYNAGIAVYTFVQMLIVTGCFTYTLSRMARWGVSRKLLLFSAAYAALFPVIPMFGLCSSKDTLFSAFTLLFLTLLIDLLRKPGQFFASSWKIVRLITVTFLMNAFRNNAVYALVPFLLCVLLLLKRFRVKISLVLAAAVLLTVAYTGPFFSLLQIQPGKNREMLCVPMQQLARVYRDNPDAFDEAQRQTLFQYLPEKGLQLYQPRWADPVKSSFRDEAFVSDKKSFLSLWLQAGIRNPGLYLDSFLENTLYAWYPDSVIDGYNRQATAEDDSVYPLGKTSYMEFRVERPGSLDSKFPALYQLYEKIAKDYGVYQVPVISMLFSVGFQLWGLLASLFYAVHRKRKAAFLPALFMLLLSMTVLLGPMILVRYFLILFFALPLTLSFLLQADLFQAQE